MLKIKIQQYKSSIKDDCIQINKNILNKLIEIKYKISIENENENIFSITGKCIKYKKKSIDSTITIVGNIDKQNMLLTFPIYSTIIQSINILN